MIAAIAALLLAAPARAGQIIVPTPPPLVRPDGSDIHAPPRVILPEGSVRLDPAKPVLEPGDPEAAPLAKALEESKPLSPMLPPGPRDVAAEAEKPAKSAAAQAIEALQQAGEFDGAQRLKQQLASESFAPAKDWAPASRFDIEDKLRAAAKEPPAKNQAMIRALFMKYGDRLDWNGVRELLSRLTPTEDGSAQRLRDELIAAFRRERAS